jgi:hypothetical protein
VRSGHPISTPAAAFARARSEGQALTWEQAVEEALRGQPAV